MINLIIWLAAFLCHNPTHTAANHGRCKLVHSVGANSADTGGETGGTPKPTIPPPPPPPPAYGG